MSINQNRDFLSLSQEDVMKHYAKVVLKQNDYGQLEFMKATLGYLLRVNAPLDKWRRELKLGKYPVKARIENWSFDSARIEQDFAHCLSRTVKYGNGGTTTRIIGYDLDTRRIVTETGSVYELVAE